MYYDYICITYSRVITVLVQTNWSHAVKHMKRIAERDNYGFKNDHQKFVFCTVQ